MVSQEHVGQQFSRPFGPGGKYTTRAVDMFGNDPGDPKYVSRIEAVHSTSGRRLGYLSVIRGDEQRPSEIHKVYVSGNQRRKGVATVMLDHAREVFPDLQHSTALHPDGAAFAKARPLDG